VVVACRTISHKVTADIATSIERLGVNQMPAGALFDQDAKALRRSHSHRRTRSDRALSIHHVDIASRLIEAKYNEELEECLLLARSKLFEINGKRSHTPNIGEKR